MFKKALIASAILAASTGIAFANGGTPSTYTPPMASTMHDFYVGAGVSRDFGTFNFQTTEYDSLGSGQILDTTNTDFGKDGWNGDLFGGLGFTFQDHYYLAGEIFGSISNVKATSSYTALQSNGVVVSATPIELKLRHSYGVSLIPGLKLNDSTMLYGRVGWIRSRFGITLSNGVQSIDNNTSKNGLQLGVGLNTMVTNNVSARMEYDWNDYGKISQNIYTNSVLTDNLTVKPRVDQLKLAVIYHFMAAA